jgi:pimeloyl-ACP methyl ester carboxylesterase
MEHSTLKQYQIFYFPGLGADTGLFKELIELMPGETVKLYSDLPYPKVKDYAKTILPTIDTTKPLLLIGFSFGAMVAKELAQLIREKENAIKIFLIMLSSPHDASSVDQKFKDRVHFLKLIPSPLLRFFIVQIGPLFAKRFDRLNREQKTRLRSMAKSMDLEQFHKAALACAKWDDHTHHSIDVKTLTIHGENDRIIPYNKTRADYIIPKSGHLISMTHPNTIRSIITKEIA